METHKPVHTLSCGTLRLAVWKHISDFGEFFNLGIHRVFMRNGQWEKSTYFSEYDLLTLSQMVIDAHSWIQDQKKSEVKLLSMPEVQRDDEESPIEN